MNKLLFVCAYTFLKSSNLRCSDWFVMCTVTGVLESGFGLVLCLVKDKNPKHNLILTLTPKISVKKKTFVHLATSSQILKIPPHPDFE